MTRNRKIAIGSVATLVVAAASVLAVWMLSPRPSVDYVHLGLRPTIQLRTEAPDECFRLNKLDLDGKPVEQQPVQCNGDMGLVDFDKQTHNVSKRVLFFKDSDRKRLDAEYARDGVQVVNGFELRDDGSTRWQATLDHTTGLVTTQTYWWNGKLFSVQKRAADSEVADTMYYRDDGKPWLHYVGKAGVLFSAAHTGGLGLVSATLWNADGKLVYDMHVDGDAAEAIYYRPDGTPSYKQLLHMYTWSSMEGGVSSRAFTVFRVSLFDEPGTHVLRDLFVSPTYFTAIGAIDYNADGSRTALDIKPAGNVDHETKFNRDGYKIADKPVNDPKRKVDTDYKQTSSTPTVDVEPITKWHEQEALHFPHTIVQ